MQPQPARPHWRPSLVAQLSLEEEELGEDVPGLISEADRPSTGCFAIPGQWHCGVGPGPGSAAPWRICPAPGSQPQPGTTREP